MEQAPDIQECKIIILKVIEQAIKDYEYYRDRTSEEDKEIFESAEKFLFNDDYFVDWGDERVNLSQLLDAVDINIDWIRNKIAQKLDVKFLPTEGIVVPNQRY